MLKEKGPIKFSMLVRNDLEKWNNAIGEMEPQTIYIRSEAITIKNRRFNINDAFAKLMLLLDIWQGEVSGWRIKQVQDIHININKYDPLAGISYLPLPLI